MYLLDTNTLIYFFKGQGRVADNVLSVAPGETFLPCIAVYEIETGLAKSRHPARLRQDLEDFLAWSPCCLSGWPKPGQRHGSEPSRKPRGLPLGHMISLSPQPPWPTD